MLKNVAVKQRIRPPYNSNALRRKATATTRAHTPTQLLPLSVMDTTRRPQFEYSLRKTSGPSQKTIWMIFGNTACGAKQEDRKSYSEKGHDEGNALKTSNCGTFIEVQKLEIQDAGTYSECACPQKEARESPNDSSTICAGLAWGRLFVGASFRVVVFVFRGDIKRYTTSFKACLLFKKKKKAKRGTAPGMHRTLGFPASGCRAPPAGSWPPRAAWPGKRRAKRPSGEERTEGTAPMFHENQRVNSVLLLLLFWLLLLFSLFCGAPKMGPKMTVFQHPPLPGLLGVVAAEISSKKRGPTDGF